MKEFTLGNKSEEKKTFSWPLPDFFLLISLSLLRFLLLRDIVSPQASY